MRYSRFKSHMEKRCLEGRQGTDHIRVSSRFETCGYPHSQRRLPDKKSGLLPLKRILKRRRYGDAAVGLPNCGLFTSSSSHPAKQGFVDDDEDPASRGNLLVPAVLARTGQGSNIKPCVPYRELSPSWYTPQSSFDSGDSPVGPKVPVKADVPPDNGIVHFNSAMPTGWQNVDGDQNWHLHGLDDPVKQEVVETEESQDTAASFQRTVSQSSDGEESLSELRALGPRNAYVVSSQHRAGLAQANSCSSTEALDVGPATLPDSSWNRSGSAVPPNYSRGFYSLDDHLRFFNRCRSG